MYGGCMAVLKMQNDSVAMTVARTWGIQVALMVQSAGAKDDCA